MVMSRFDSGFLYKMSFNNSIFVGHEHRFCEILICMKGITQIIFNLYIWTSVKKVKSFGCVQTMKVLKYIYLMHLHILYDQPLSPFLVLQVVQ